MTGECPASPALWAGSFTLLWFFEYAGQNPATCWWHSIVGKYLRGTEELPRYPTYEQIQELMGKAGGREKLLEKMNPWDKAMSMFTYVPTCGACLTKCPAPWA